MSDKTERFKKRQRIKKLSKSESLESKAKLVDQADVETMLNQGFDAERVEQLNYSTELRCSFTENPQEVSETLAKLRNEFNRERFSTLLQEMGQDVIHTVAGPLGLGKVWAAYDKHGGNVTTTHNAQQGVYAHESDEYSRADYDRSKNSSGQRFSGAGKNSAGANYTRSKMDDQGTVIDEYTGKRQRADTTSPDHVYSLHDYHKDGGFMSSSQRKADFATDEDNLAMTDRSINQSMQDADKETWMGKRSTKDKTKTNEEYYDVDVKAVKSAVEKGKAAAHNHLPSTKDKALYYVKNTTVTGADEGLKMGTQQVVGLLAVEFFSQVFHETNLAFKKGLEGKNLVEDLKVRFKRVAKKLSEKWKDVAKVFSGGFLSGFMSNLITVAVNMVKTTGAKVVRLIREGLFSLFKAVKTILFKPEGMTRAQSLHEATKIIFAGGILVGGIALEEGISSMLSGFVVLKPFVDVLTAAIVGFVTVLVSATVTYLLDKLDLFNAVRMERNQFVIDRLGSDIQGSLDSCEAIAEEIDQYLLA